MWPLAEVERLVAQMIRMGTIKSVDLSDATAPRCIVTNAGLDTDSIPWIQLRAGNDTESWIPDIGEQAIVFSPFGDMAQGVALVGINSAAFPAPSMDPDIRTTRYKDGGTITYNRATSEYMVNVPEAGRIVLQVGASSLVMQNGGTVLTTPTFEHVGQSATFDGTVLVKMLLSYLNGMAGQPGTSGLSGASIQGGIKISDGNVVVTDGDVIADTISLKGHHHTAQGQNAPTTVSQA